MFRTISNQVRALMRACQLAGVGTAFVIMQPSTAGFGRANLTGLMIETGRRRPIEPDDFAKPLLKRAAWRVFDGGGAGRRSRLRPATRPKLVHDATLPPSAEPEWMHLLRAYTATTNPTTFDL